jgi:hypothetical protein
MKRPQRPFRVPRKIAPDLARVAAYWRGLLRGSATIPFSDDLDLNALSDLRPRLLVIETFAMPERFRLDIVGKEAQTSIGPSIEGQFTDEIRPEAPLDLLRSQCSAVVETGLPTYYEQGQDISSRRRGYARLLLPMWGDGHINILLGAIEWMPSTSV